MTTANFAFTCNDTIIKWLAADDGGAMPLFQTVFLRGLVVTALLAGLALRTHGAIRFSQLTNRPLQLRVALEMLATVTFLLTLTHVPIADLAAIVQLVPLAVTFAAARLLHEQVRPARIAALVLGLVGVLLVIRPGTDAFTPWYLLGVLTVGIVVLRELATRSITSEVPSLVIALATSAAITLMGGVISVFEGWVPIGSGEVLLLLLGAAFLGLAYFSSVTTIRTGDVSFSALFRYTALVFAMIMQLVVFTDPPDTATIAGAVIIAIAGLWGLAQERDRRSAVTS